MELSVSGCFTCRPPQWKFEIKLIMCIMYFDIGWATDKINLVQMRDILIFLELILDQIIIFRVLQHFTYLARKKINNIHFLAEVLQRIPNAAIKMWDFHFEIVIQQLWHHDKPIQFPLLFN